VSASTPVRPAPLPTNVAAVALPERLMSAAETVPVAMMISLASMILPSTVRLPVSVPPARGSLVASVVDMPVRLDPSPKK